MAFPFTGDLFPNTDFNKVNLDWFCDTLQKDRADIDQNTADIEELKNTVIDYDDLINKPQINSVTLSGNKSLSDIGAASVDEVNDLKSHNGINGDWINPNYIDSVYTEFDTEVGNFYNSGYVIKTSANGSYRRSLINIENISFGYVFVPYDNITPNNGKMYLSNTATIDGTSENYVQLLTPTASDIVKSNIGLTKVNGVYAVDIYRLKQSYPTTKALCPYALDTAWFTPYYYIPPQKNLKWLTIDESNINRTSELYKTAKIGIDEPVVFFGDSMTRGATNSYNNPYPKQFSTLSDLEIVNGGVGGESVADIMSRQGSEPIIVEPFIIPATTDAVEVSISSNMGDSLSILKTTDNEFWLVNPVFVSGIKGSLSYSSSKYYFTRDEAGPAKTITRPVPVITYASMTYRQNTSVFWTQNNGDVSADVLLNNFEEFVRYLQTDKYILMSPTKGYGSTYAGVEAALTQKYGRKYINLRQYLLAYGLSDLNITPTAQDTTDISQGVIPTSLKTDSVHFTTETYGIVARLVYERGIELGYWD